MCVVCVYVCVCVCIYFNALYHTFAVHAITVFDYLPISLDIVRHVHLCDLYKQLQISCCEFCEFGLYNILINFDEFWQSNDK